MLQWRYIFSVMSRILFWGHKTNPYLTGYDKYNCKVTPLPKHARKTSGEGEV